MALLGKLNVIFKLPHVGNSKKKYKNAIKRPQAKKKMAEKEIKSVEDSNAEIKEPTTYLRLKGKL